MWALTAPFPKHYTSTNNVMNIQLKRDKKCIFDT